MLLRTARRDYYDLSFVLLEFLKRSTAEIPLCSVFSARRYSVLFVFIATGLYDFTRDSVRMRVAVYHTLWRIVCTDATALYEYSYQYDSRDE
jgi:hypothetical protein